MELDVSIDQVLKDFHPWARSVIETVDVCLLDLFLFGNAFRVEGSYPKHWRRLDPTKAVGRTIMTLSGQQRVEWQHPDAPDEIIKSEHLTSYSGVYGISPIEAPR